MSEIIYDFKAIGATLRRRRLDDLWQPAKLELEPRLPSRYPWRRRYFLGILPRHVFFSRGGCFSDIFGLKRLSSLVSGLRRLAIALTVMVPAIFRTPGPAKRPRCLASIKNDLSAPDPARIV